MAITKKSYKGTLIECVQEFVCDHRSDIGNLPT